MFLGQGLSLLSQVFYFILLARLLGPTEYGIYAGVFAMTAVLSVYSSLGSAFTMIRHVSPAPEEFAAYWGNVLMTTLMLGICSPSFWYWLFLTSRTPIRGNWCSVSLSATACARN